MVQHFCDGTCCKSDVDAKVNLYGVLLECDISFADDMAEPSMDDWGTCGKAAGKASFGIMCHDLVSQIVEGAIPSYNSIPNVNEEETDEAAIMRAKIRKKAYRCRCWLGDVEQKLACFNYIVNGMSIEHLIQQLDQLDSHANGLADVFNDDLSPFTQARQALADLLCNNSADAPFSTIIAHFRYQLGEYDKFDILQALRATNLDMTAQVVWRFLKYELPPITLLSPGLVGYAEADHFAHIDATFKAPECCRGPDYEDKLTTLFPNTACVLASDEYRRGCRLVLHAYKFTDMNSERLLARIRQSVDGHMKKCSVERVCGNGFLSQHRYEHARLGRPSPCVRTRRQLLDQGVPIRATKKPCSTKVGGSFFSFKSKAEAARRDSIAGSMTKEAYKQFLRDLAIEFSNATDEQRAAERAEMNSKLVDRLAKATEPSAEVACRDYGVLRSVVQDQGNATSPLPTEAFIAEIKKQLDLPPDAPTPGFTAYEGPLCKQMQADLFCPDFSAIPPEDVFSYRLPCPFAHPGICASRDAAVYAHIRSSSKAAWNVLKDLPGGTAFLLQALYDDATDDEEAMMATVPCMLAHYRGSGPRLAILALLEDVGGNVYEIKSEATRGIMCKLDISVIGQFWLRCPLQKFELVVLPLDRTFTEAGNRVRVDTTKVTHTQIVHPYHAPPREVKSSELKAMLAGLNACTVIEKKTRSTAVRIKMPKVDGVASSSESDHSGLGSRSSGSESDASIDPDPGVGPKAKPKAAPKSKVKRGVMVDGEAMTELPAGGVLSGMSINCTNPVHEDCAKDCHGIRSGKLSKEEVCRRLLIWRDRGLADDIRTRADHIALGGRLLSDFA